MLKSSDSRICHKDLSIEMEILERGLEVEPESFV